MVVVASHWLLIWKLIAAKHGRSDGGTLELTSGQEALHCPVVIPIEREGRAAHLFRVAKPRGSA